MPDNTYGKQFLKLWSGDQTMQHASGIWGRTQFLQLAKKMSKKQKLVVDLGCGPGYLTYQIAKVSKSRLVIGYDINNNFIKTAKKNYSKQINLVFHRLNILKGLPIPAQKVDLILSCMVFHNLNGESLTLFFHEAARVLKKNKKGLFMTIHPSALNSDWDLKFMKYDTKAIAKWKRTKKEIKIPGVVINANGGKKKVFMYPHTLKSIQNALTKNGLKMTMQIPIFVDEKTAIQKFGKKAIKKIPTNPLFWIFEVTKI